MTYDLYNQYANAARNIQNNAGNVHLLAAYANYRNDRSIIDAFQDIVTLLEEQLRPLVLAELSVLVDIFYKPETLFPANSSAKKSCNNGGFICKLIKHTEKFWNRRNNRRYRHIYSDVDWTDRSVRRIRQHLLHTGHLSNVKFDDQKTDHQIQQSQSVPVSIGDCGYETNTSILAAFVRKSQSSVAKLSSCSESENQLQSHNRNVDFFWIVSVALLPVVLACLGCTSTNQMWL